MEYTGFPTAEDKHREMTEGANMVRALLFGLAAGTVGAAIWFAIVVVTNYEVGLLAVLIGAMVGTAVMIGSGRKRNLQLQLLSVLITVAAMAVAEYFIVRHFVVEYLVQHGQATSAQVPLFLPLEMAWDFVVGALQDDPLTLLFWGIAVWTAFRVPRAQKVAKVPVATPATQLPPAPPA